MEFPGGSVGEGSSVVTAVVQIQSLAWQFLHSRGTAKEKFKRCLRKYRKRVFPEQHLLNTPVPAAFSSACVMDHHANSQDRVCWALLGSYLALGEGRAGLSISRLRENVSNEKD